MKDTLENQENTPMEGKTKGVGNLNLIYESGSGF